MMPPQLLNLKLCPAISLFGIRMMIIVVIIVRDSCIIIIVVVVVMQRWQLIWWRQILCVMQIIVLHIIVIVIVRVAVADVRQAVQHLQRHIIVDRWRRRLHRCEYLKIVHLLILHQLQVG